MKQRFTNERGAPQSGTQAVERALAVLHAVGGTREPLGLAALAGQLGLHKTTVFRLLGALERAGFVTRDDDRQRYGLGPALIQLGARARRSIGLIEAARAELDALAAETGETITLEVLVGSDVLILDEVHGRFLIGSRPEIGTRWPAHATSTGKVLLAALAPAQRGTGRLARLGPHTITSRAALNRTLAAVRTQGFAIAREELEAGFVAVAAPVRNSLGGVVAAISIGGPSTRLTTSRTRTLTALVRTASARATARLAEASAVTTVETPPSRTPQLLPS